ncbi:hypothetical protein AAFF_G00346230 [Aldrovandia affinis]|uniref:Endonuclease n=1 Tax=Aldrovandia affinis TaxID=143900 RepID=A0AAD7WP09_9TELE|nr:hypothetical protein AAFF_G00346230 [Aldrovandia affinis]
MHLQAHLFPTWGDVVGSFRTSRNCTSFNQGKVPEWGAATPGAASLCQRFHNSYHFTTLYNTHHRIAVYSAYRFQTSDGGGWEKRWFVEPQLVDLTWGVEMRDGYWLGQDNPDIYLGERQALNEDYTHSGFDRGHLNPNGHHAVPSCNATFMLTNMVPQGPKLNQNAWHNYESQLTDLFNGHNWIFKNVNIPEYLWNAYCCLDNNGTSSAGATALNTEQNWVGRHTIADLTAFLQQYANSPVGELFFNNSEA